MDNLLTTSATQIAAAIRAREVSCTEVMQTYLERIDAVNPKLNAIVYHDKQQALDAAAVADQALQDDVPVGPLHGIPVSIKDNISVAGMTCTTGTVGYANNVPTEDAEMVKRLKQAGAIIIGMSNMPELGTSFESDNLVYGRTNNPYDLTRTSGGSSGGESSAISSGMSALGLGNDGAGSVRTPAGWCALVGLKPTTGRLPVTGHVTTSYSGYYPGVSSDGPLARYAEDINLVMPLISGPDGSDPMLVPMPVRDMHDVDLSSLRVAYYADDGWMTPEAPIQAAVADAAKALTEMGVQVSEAKPTCLVDAHDIRLAFYGAVSSAGVLDGLKAMGTPEPSHLLQKWLDDTAPYRDYTKAELLALNKRLGNFRHEMLVFMQDYDAILCPVSAVLAPKHGDASFKPASYTIAFNLTTYPATSVNVGMTPEGLPVAVQLAAHPWREDVALALASALEKAFGGYQPPKL